MPTLPSLDPPVPEVPVLFPVPPYSPVGHTNHQDQRDCYKKDIEKAIHSDHPPVFFDMFFRIQNLNLPFSYLPYKGRSADGILMAKLRRC